MRVLPALWFLLAILGLVAGGAQVAFLFPQAGGFALFGVSLLQYVSATIGTVTIGLVYLYILSTRPSSAVQVIGASHLVMAACARIGLIIGEGMRIKLITGADSSSVATMGFVFTASSIAGSLSGIVFILALIVALNTRHQEPPEEVF